MSTTKISSLADLLGIEDRKYVEVPVPQWGGSVRVRSLDAGEAIQFAEANKINAKTATLRLVALSLCDEEGNRIVPDNKVDALKAKNVEALTVIAQAALELNGYTKAAKDDVKNDSGEAPSDASPTDSQ